MTPFESLSAVSYSLFVATMAVSLAVCEILSVKEGRDLEKLGYGLFKVDRQYTTFYRSAIVNIALSCAIFELVDVE